MADQGYDRMLSHIFSGDIKGYSKLTEKDEEASVRTPKIYRSVI